MTLPADWPEQRETLRCIATHLLARARYEASGRFSLEPTVGGFGTPTFTTADGSFRRLRVTVGVGAYLVDEHVDSTGAAARHFPLSDAPRSPRSPTRSASISMPNSRPATTPRSSATRIGRARHRPHRPSRWSPTGTPSDRWRSTESVERTHARRAGVARVWPEHFDLGTDIEVAPGRRCNLGASPGDGWHPDPYLYVGPWGDERPGDDGFWNAPFGAVRGYADIVDTEAPSSTATAFFHDGIRRLGA